MATDAWTGHLRAVLGNSGRFPASWFVGGAIAVAARRDCLQRGRHAGQRRVYVVIRALEAEGPARSLWVQRQSGQRLLFLADNFGNRFIRLSVADVLLAIGIVISFFGF